MTLDFANRFVEEYVGINPVLVRQTVAVEKNLVYMSGRKKFASRYAAFCQSRGCIARIVDGGTLASVASIAVMTRVSKTGFHRPSAKNSSMTGLPTRSMSAAVGSRKTISLIVPPLPLATSCRSGSRPLKPLTCAGCSSAADVSAGFAGSLCGAWPAVGPFPSAMKDSFRRRLCGRRRRDRDIAHLLLARDAFEAHAHLALTCVELQCRFAPCLGQDIDVAVGELRRDGRIRNRLDVLHRELRQQRDVALDVGHARQFRIAVHVILPGDAGALIFRRRHREIAAQWEHVGIDF